MMSELCSNKWDESCVVLKCFLLVICTHTDTLQTNAAVNWRCCGDRGWWAVSEYKVRRCGLGLNYCSVEWLGRSEKGGGYRVQLLEMKTEGCSQDIGQAEGITSDCDCRVIISPILTKKRIIIRGLSLSNTVLFLTLAPTLLADCP